MIFRNLEKISVLKFEARNCQNEFKIRKNVKTSNKLINGQFKPFLHSKVTFPRLKSEKKCGWGFNFFHIFK